MAGLRDEVAEVARWSDGIKGVHWCIAGWFRRPEPRRRALNYLRGLLSPVERKNGWQQAGDATSDGVQRLLSSYRWDADLVRDDLREYVIEHLADDDAVLVVDETGFLNPNPPKEGVGSPRSSTVEPGQLPGPIESRIVQGRVNTERGCTDGRRSEVRRH